MSGERTPVAPKGALTTLAIVTSLATIALPGLQLSELGRSYLPVVDFALPNALDLGLG